MKNLTPLLLGLVLAATGLSGCEKDDAFCGFTPTTEQSSAGTLTFGWFHGFCAGERCMEIYQLDPSRKMLLEDINDSYPRRDVPYTGNFIARSQADYQKVQDLPQLVPAQLLLETSPVIGQPDVTDGGGYYVELNQNGQRRFWLIDAMRPGQPAYLQAFADTLHARISRLP
jgi:hypothetical protein